MTDDDEVEPGRAQPGHCPPEGPALPPGLRFTISDDQSAGTITWAGSGQESNGGFIVAEMREHGDDPNE